MKLPQELIDFILHKDFWIGDYPELVQFLLDNIKDNNYYIHIYPENLGRFKAHIFRDGKAYEEYVEREKRIDEHVKRQREIRSRQVDSHNSNPIIIELRNAIQSSNFEKIIEIKRMMKDAGYDVSELSLKNIMQRKL